TAATARGVLLRVQAVIDTGGPISSLLDELAATGVTVPAALRDVPAGVPTVSQLQDSFPEAARTAAAASIKVSPDATLGDRTLTFLRRHTGARSLTPRDGADPDAVLSRAEAALRGGDVAGALAQLDQLPADAQAAMSEWRASAQTRVAASVALGELTAGLSGN
ncbi:MAG: hypothetical protein Q7J57_08415, partial [Gemmobacter sp.]|nr:hypothetical protein [Gemmobacter sp.]